MLPVANPNPDRARRGAAVETPEPVIEELLPVRPAAAPTTAALVERWESDEDSDGSEDEVDRDGAPAQ